MGGEDGPDGEPPDERIELGVRPAQAAQAGDGVGDRVVQDAVTRRPLAPAQGPDATPCLGQVDEPEVERERPDDGLGIAEIERSQVIVEPRPLRRIVVAPEGDGPAPDPLDRGEQLGSGLLRDDLAEQCAEQPDLDRERVAGAGRADPERLGGDGAATAGCCMTRSRDRRARTVPRPSRLRIATFRTATFL